MTHIQEEWKPVVGYEGLYEVSSLCQVRTVAKRGAIPAGKILSQRPSRFGYLTVKLTQSGIKGGQRYHLHRLVAEAFLGPRPSSMTVNHIDGNKLNNLPNNLEYLSLRDNIRHAWNLGLMNPRQYISNDVKLEIAALSSEMGYKRLAKKFGVTRSTAMRIARKARDSKATAS